MEAIVNNKLIKLQNTDMFGAEGEIYTAIVNGETKCIKIYDPLKRKPYQEKKVLSLIQRFNQYGLGGIEKQLAYPEAPVYDAVTKQFCGFVMKYFEGYKQLSNCTYNLSDLKYEESQKEDYYLGTIHLLFIYLELIHDLGIVIGDLNPQNILISDDSPIPAIVDIDSVQVGTFHSNSQRKEYTDPRVQTDGYGNNKFFVYSTDSDIFSLSVIAYELIVGSNPYFFQTNPPTSSYYKKENDLSRLHFLSRNEGTSPDKKLEVIKNDFYYASNDRLLYIQENHPILFLFFKDIFIKRQRRYLMLEPILKKPSIHLKKSKNIQGLMHIMSYSKHDPEELSFFIEQYDLNL